MLKIGNFLCLHGRFSQAQSHVYSEIIQNYVVVTVIYTIHIPGRAATPVGIIAGVTSTPPIVLLVEVMILVEISVVSVVVVVVITLVAVARSPRSDKRIMESCRSIY